MSTTVLPFFSIHFFKSVALMIKVVTNFKQLCNKLLAVVYAR